MYFQNLWVVLVISVVALAMQCGAQGFPDHLSCEGLEGTERIKCKALKCLEDTDCSKWIRYKGNVNAVSVKLEEILTETAQCQEISDRVMRRKCDMMACMNNENCRQNYTLAIEICTEINDWVKYCASNVFKKILDES